MKLVHPNVSKEIVWNESAHIWEIVIEQPQFLRNILKDFSQHVNDKGINFLQNGQPLDINSDIDTIFNPFNLDFNNRRALTALLKTILATSTKENIYEETNAMKSKILKYMSHVIDASNFDFEVDTSDFLADALAKAVNVHIVGEDSDFVQLLVEYMVMMRDLIGIKLFCFVNLRSMIANEEAKDLVHNTLNHQLDVLLIESKNYNPLSKTARLIIDRDLCEI
jgi:CRISPR type II-A-associated protein Csn2